MNNISIKMVAIDIDGTMLTNGHRLLREVVVAVRRAVEDGLVVVPATARSPQGLEKIADELGIIGPVVCLNGAWTGMLDAVSAESKNKSYPIPENLVFSLILEAEKMGLNPCCYTVDGMYALSHGVLVERELRATGQMAEIINPSTIARMSIMKVLLLESCPHQALPLTDRFNELRFVSSGMSLVEVVDARVSKREAIAKLAAELNISQDQVAMIGDSGNDLEAIEWAGLGIAMGNSSQEVLAEADLVVATNEQAGVTDALEYIMNINSAVGKVKA